MSADLLFANPFSNPFIVLVLHLFSFVCLIPFAVPINSALCNRRIDCCSRQLRSEFQIVVRGCLLCLAVLIGLLTLPNCPEVPNFWRLASGESMETTLRFSDPILYWLYWLTFDTMQVSSLLVLHSSLTKKSVWKCLRNGLLLSACTAGTTTIGYIIGFSEPKNVNIVNGTDFVLSGVRSVIFLYSILENRARRSFSVFACYGFGCNFFMPLSGLLFPGLDASVQIAMVASFVIIRGLALIPCLLFSLRSDTIWWRRGLRNDAGGESLLAEESGFVEGDLETILDDYGDYYIRQNLFSKTGEYLGDGGFGYVAEIQYSQFLCFHPKTAVIKKFKEDIPIKERIPQFRAEISMLIKAQGPGIVQFFGFCIQPPALALVFEKATGRRSDLAAEILEEDTLAPLGKIELAAQCARAVEHLHEREILHRDIKAANILVFLGPKRNVLKLTDFGSACLETDLEAISQAPHQVCTANYRAPELNSDNDGKMNQCDKFSKKSDVYALGCVLWHIAVRKEPIKPLETRTQSSPDLDWNQLVCMPSTFRNIVMGCLNPDPKNRPTAYQVRNQLEKCIKDREQAVTPHSSRTVQEDFSQFEVSTWLHKCGCEFAEQTLRENGFDQLKKVVLIEQSILDSMNISVADRLLLRDELKRLKLSSRQYLEDQRKHKAPVLLEVLTH